MVDSLTEGYLGEEKKTMETKMLLAMHVGTPVPGSGEHKTVYNFAVPSAPGCLHTWLRLPLSLSDIHE